MSARGPMWPRIWAASPSPRSWPCSGPTSPCPAERLHAASRASCNPLILLRLVAAQRILAPARTLCPVMRLTVVRWCAFTGDPEHLMAAAFAQYATTQTHEQRGPSPWTAALLTVLTPGLG